jgi:hypothetical protein
MSCVTFSKAFQDNMAALGMPAPPALFFSLAAALKHLGVMIDAFEAAGSRATVAQMMTAAKLRESFDAMPAGSAIFYIGAVIGSIQVARNAAGTCSANVSAAQFRTFANWLSSRGALIPMELLTFLQNHREVMEDSAQRKSYAMRARQHGETASAAAGE